MPQMGKVDFLETLSRMYKDSRILFQNGEYYNRCYLDLYDEQRFPGVSPGSQDKMSLYFSRPGRVSSLEPDLQVRRPYEMV